MSGYSTSVYFKKIKLNKVRVGYLQNKIQQENFYDFITSKMDFFLNPLIKEINEFEVKFNSSEGLNRYSGKTREKDIQGRVAQKFQEIYET